MNMRCCNDNMLCILGRNVFSGIEGFSGIISSNQIIGHVLPNTFYFVFLQYIAFVLRRRPVYFHRHYVCNVWLMVVQHRLNR